MPATYTAAEMAYRAGSRRIYDAQTERERFVARQFSGVPAATPKAKAHLRALLAQHAGATVAAELRAYFNGLRESGDPITAADVAAAIRILKG